MKRHVVLFGALFLLFLLPMHRLEAKVDSLRTVVIDAGHGGDDPGAIGSGVKEKNVTLKLALKLGAIIKEEFPDVKVVYTRSTDVFVELFRRAQIANNAKADLFISLHCNAAKSTSAYGTETFVMGLHKSAASLEVARLENASILLEENYEAQYEGFDPNSAESYALFSLFQNAFIDQSLQLAAHVESEFKSIGRSSRGVKQAGFLVLWRTSMPSILVEAGFLSNPNEVKFLASESGQNSLAASIFKAFQTYKAEVDKMAAEYVRGGKRPSAPSTSNAVVNTSIDSLSSQVASNTRSEPEIYLSVQFFTSKESKPLNDHAFKGLQGVWVYRHNDTYKYAVGKETSLKSALAVLEQVKGKGFSDAFLVGFKNGERVSWQQASAYLSP